MVELGGVAEGELEQLVVELEGVGVVHGWECELKGVGEGGVDRWYQLQPRNF